MTKRLSLALVATCCALALAACAGSDDGEPGEQTGGGDSQATATQQRDRVSAVESAPRAQGAEARLVARNEALPPLKSLRTIGRVRDIAWYIAETKNGELCLMSRGTSSRGICGADPLSYTGGFLIAIPASRTTQLSALVVADAYSEVQVTDGTARRVLPIRHNVLFVLHDQDITVKLTGEGSGSRREVLPYHGPYG